MNGPVAPGQPRTSRRRIRRPASLVLPLPFVALIVAPLAAQDSRVEIGASGAYVRSSSMLPDESGGDRVALHPMWSAQGSVSLWLDRALGLRLSADYARTSLVRTSAPLIGLGGGGTVLDDDVRLLAGSASFLLRPFGTRSIRPLLFVPLRPYIAVGGGALWVNPIPGERCAGGDAPCGHPFTVDGDDYVLERRILPTAQLALGLDVPLHPQVGLRLEVGDRLSQSPVAHAPADGSSSSRAVRGLVHTPYASLGARVSSPSPVTSAPPRHVGVAAGSLDSAVVSSALDAAADSLRAARTDAVADSTAGSRPAAAAMLADTTATLRSLGARVDTLAALLGALAPAAGAAGAVGAAAGATVAPVAGVRPVAAVAPVDSVQPRPIGNDGYYDVVLDIPNVSVDEITLEVDNIHAHVSLDAKVAKLVSLNVGADAGIERVFLGIRGVQAEAYLKVDLDNVATIVDRVLTTIDRNPQIISELLQTLETTVATVGDVANTALQPGGVVSQAVETVGEVANVALQPGGVISQTVQTVGDVANTALQPGGVVSQAVQTVGEVANTTLQPGGVASQLVGSVGGTLENLSSEGGLLSAEGVNALGQTVVRAVDGTGRIVERTLDQTGTIVGENVIGDVLQLPVLGQTLGAAGQTLVAVQDASGAVIGAALDSAGSVIATRVIAPAGSPLADQLRAVGAQAAPAPTTVPLTGPAARKPGPAPHAPAPTAAPPGTASQPGPAGPLLLLAAGVDAAGRAVQRVVESTGMLVERTVDPISGNVLARRQMGSVVALAPISQTVDSAGNIVRVVRDASGGVAELTIGAGGTLRRMRTVRLGDLGGAVAAAAEVVEAAASLAPEAASVAERVTEVAGGAVETVADSLPAILIGQYANERGQLVQRFVDLSGNITERSLNAAGQMIVKRRAANVRRLPLVREYGAAGGRFVRLVRDPMGALLELTFERDGKLGGVRVLEMGRPGAAPPRRSSSGARERAPTIGAMPVRGTARPAAAPVAPVVGPAVAALLAQSADTAGRLLQRVVETSGKIVERTVAPTGRVLSRREVGDLLQLRVLSQLPQPDGRLLLITRDATGVLLEVLLGADRKVVSVQPLMAMR